MDLRGIGIAVAASCLYRHPVVAAGRSRGRFPAGGRDADGVVDIGDAAFINDYLYQGGSIPTCENAADSNDDGKIDLTDEIYVLSFVFQGGKAPPSPGPFTPGPDTTPSPRITSPCIYNPSPPAAIGQMALGFQPVNQVDGDPGSTVSIDVYPTLTSSTLDPAGHGPEAWSLSIEVEGAEVDFDTTGVYGVMVTTSYRDRFGQVHDSYSMDLGTADFVVLEGAALPDLPALKGVVSSVFLKVSSQFAYLHPNSTDTVLHLVLKATAPAEGSCSEVVVRYVDGLQPADFQPVRNVVVQGGTSQAPSLGEVRIQVCGKGPPQSGNFLRGDLNGNGRIELGDVVWELRYMFGDAGNYPIACARAADTNDDGQANLADPIFLLSYYLMGGSRPDEPFSACGQDAATTADNCPAGSTLCF